MQNNTNITVVINTLNEEKNLGRALASVKKIASEVVVVDMHSDDGTVKIAKEFGAKVYTFERKNYVEPARNFAISKATNDWILILDADEELSVELTNKLLEVIKTQEVSVWRLPRKNIIFGKWMQHARWWPDYNIRFFKKDCVEWSDEIHSVPITTGNSGQIEDKEELAIIHHNYQSIDQFINRMNRYTTIQSDRLIANKHQFYWTDLFIKPSAEFLGRFFAGEGYKDGVHGLALSLLQAFSELVVFLKVWEAHKFKEANLRLTSVAAELKKIEKETHYWIADAHVKETKSLKHRIKRKFKLG
jgi:glycosyltransferase involved in cell wall biosynthesis